MSEYKLEDAETVALSDATKIFGLDTNGVPCWIDPVTVAQGSFAQWLLSNPDVLQFWYPDQFAVTRLYKVHADPSSHITGYQSLTEEVDGVQAYAYGNGLMFQNDKGILNSLNYAELAIIANTGWYEDGDGARVRKNSGQYATGLNLREVNSINGRYVIQGGACSGNGVSCEPQVYVDTIDRWNVLAVSTMVSDLTMTSTLMFNGVEVDTDVDTGTQAQIAINGRISQSYVGAIAAQGGLMPALHILFRRPITAVESAEIFARFKAAHSLA